MKKINQLSYKFVSYITAIPQEDRIVINTYVILVALGAILFAMCCILGSHVRIYQ